MIRIIIVDDHPIFRRGLMSMIAGQDDMEVVAESDGHDLVDLCRELRPDIVSMDINLPGQDGFELARQIQALDGETRILFVSMFSSRSYVRNSFRSGASGHLPKEAAAESFIRALRVVSEGGLFFPREVFAQQLEDEESGAARCGFHLLTRREKEVARLFAEGLGYKEIALKIGVSPKTIESHRLHILKKTNSRNIQQFIKAGVREGGFSG
jgi:two-component system response regulator NreC